MKTENNNIDQESSVSSSADYNLVALEETDTSSVSQSEATCSNRNEEFCRHSPQCILCQPRPAPLPLVTHLRNDVSKYHEYMMNGGLPAQYGGHDRCINVCSSKKLWLRQLRVVQVVWEASWSTRYQPRGLQKIFRNVKKLKITQFEEWWMLSDLKMQFWHPCHDT